MTTPKYVLDRAEVTAIVGSRPDEALRIARDIDEPWYRCQALACVAHHCVDREEKNRLVGEAFQAALGAPNPNRIVSVSSWPLKVVCKSQQAGLLRAEIGRLLGIIAQEPSPVRRANALNTMLGAVVSGPIELFWHVFEAFEKACFEPLLNGKRNVRGESQLVLWVPAVDRFDPARAGALLEDLKGPVLRKRGVEWLERFRQTDLEALYTWPNLR